MEPSKPRRSFENPTYMEHASHVEENPYSTVYPRSPTFVVDDDKALLTANMEDGGMINTASGDIDFK